MNVETRRTVLTMRELPLSGVVVSEPGLGVVGAAVGAEIEEFVQLFDSFELKWGKLWIRNRKYQKLAVQ
jgi:hypothetical protein